MNVYRFSDTAFEPQQQTYHFENHIEYILDDDKFAEVYNIAADKIGHFLLERRQRLIPLYTNNIEDFRKGIWCFTSKDFARMSLNHLKKKVKVFEAELPDDAIVYDVNWEYQTTLSDPRNESFGCYVPARSLAHISNIREIADFR